MMLHCGTHFLRHIHSSYIPLSNRYHHPLMYKYTVQSSPTTTTKLPITFSGTLYRLQSGFFLLTKHYTVLQYKHKYNFIYVHKKSTAFPALISRNSQMPNSNTHTPYIEFQTNQTITEVKIMDSNSIMPTCKVQLSVHPFPFLTPKYLLKMSSTMKQVNTEFFATHP